MMQNASDLVTKIMNETVREIEINGQIACSSEPILIPEPAPEVRVNGQIQRSEPIKTLSWQDVWIPIDLGNNRMVGVSYDGQINFFDLLTKKVLSTHKFHFDSAWIRSAVLLDDPKYIAIGDSYGKLHIMNLINKQITATHLIGEERSVSVVLRKNNGHLYGMTNSSTKKVFFRAPAVPDLTPKIIKIVLNTPSNNFAVDASGHAYLSYGNYFDMSTWYVRDNPSFCKLDTSLHLSTDMVVIQPKTGNSYLAVVNGDFYQDSSITIFKGKQEEERIFTSYVHSVLPFINEKIVEMDILSEKDRLLIITTKVRTPDCYGKDPTTYIYDLDQERVISQFKSWPSLSSSFRVLSEGVLFYYKAPAPEKRGEDLCILTAHKLQKDVISVFNLPEQKEEASSILSTSNVPNDLSQIFNAIKDNASVKKLTILSAELGASTLQSLYKLKIMRPELELILSPSIESALDLVKIHKTIKAEKAQLSVTLNTTIASHNEVIASKTMELERKAEECVSLGEQLNALDNEKREMQADHERHISESAALFAAEKTLHEQKIHSQAELISELKQDVVNNQTMIDSFQEEFTNISQAYSEALTLLSKKPVLSKPLLEQLEEIKEAISPELIAELVNEDTNLSHISLIRWSEQAEVQRFQNTLRQKGAILNVTDLLEQINKVKPPFNETFKKDRLLVAIERLTIDFKNGLLPSSVIKTLVSLIVPDLKNSLKTGEPQWLKKLYFLKINEIKLRLKTTFFTGEYNEDTPGLKEQYNQAISQLLHNEESDYLYHDFLVDAELLNKIRAGNGEEGFEQLVELIKEKIHLNSVELTESQKEQALHSVLNMNKPEIIKLKHDFIINYWEMTKGLLNPEIVALKAENLAIKSQLKIPAREDLTELNAAITHPAFFFSKPTPEPCLIHLPSSETLRLF